MARSAIAPGIWLESHTYRPAIDFMVGWDGPVGRSMSRLARMSVVEAKILAPRRDGRLAESIRWKKRAGPGGISFSFGSSLDYARFMEEGTRAHAIRPRTRGGLLVFFWPKVGRVVYLKSVRHPGTKPYRYLAEGFRKAFAAWKITG